MFVLVSWFELVMLLIVVGNCVALAIYNPLIPDTDPTLAILAVFDYVFLTLFTIEAIIRIIAMGFVLHPYSYLRDPWNALDFVIMILGYVSLCYHVRFYLTFSFFEQLGIGVFDKL